MQTRNLTAERLRSFDSACHDHGSKAVNNLITDRASQLVVRTETGTGMPCAIEPFRDAVLGCLGGNHGVAIERFGVSSAVTR